MSLSSHYRQNTKAIAPYEQAVQLNPERLPPIFNLVVACEGANEKEKRRHWAEIAIPRFERHLKLFPDDEDKLVNFACLLFFAGRNNEARESVRHLEHVRDAVSLYNTACLQCLLQDFNAGLGTFRKAIEAGFRYGPGLRSILDDEQGGSAKLKGTLGYEEVMQMVEEIELEM